MFFQNFKKLLAQQTNFLDRVCENINFDYETIFYFIVFFLMTDISNK